MNGGTLDNTQAEYDDGSHEYGPTPQTHAYETVTGLIVIPRCIGNPKIVRLHSGYGTRRVQWSATRVQRPPVIPAAEDLTNDTYLGGTVWAELPIPDPIRGGYNYHVKGEYVYLQTVVRDAYDPNQQTHRTPGVDSLPTGVYPYQMGLQNSQLADVLTNLDVPETANVYNVNNILGASVGDGGLVDVGSLYPWPFTSYPQAASAPQFT